MGDANFAVGLTVMIVAVFGFFGILGFIVYRDIKNARALKMRKVLVDQRRKKPLAKYNNRAPLMNADQMQRITDPIPVHSNFTL